MKLTILSRITGTAVLALLAMPTQIMAQGEQAHKREHFAHYRVTDLGTLGGTYSFAFGLNNAGEVAGGSATPNQTDFVSQTAFLWTKQTGMRDLGTLGGFNTVLNSAAGGPNAKGEAALISETFMTDPNVRTFAGSALTVNASGPSGRMGQCRRFSPWAATTPKRTGSTTKARWSGLRRIETGKTKATVSRLFKSSILKR
jgi:probable HAF family extracellular repeat protein